jgi:hypothetical protein
MMATACTHYASVSFLEFGDSRLSKKTSAGALPRPLVMGQEPFAVGTQCPFGGDVAIERLPGDAEFPAQVGYLGLRVGHSCTGEAELGRCHLVRSTTLASAYPGGQETGLGALDDQFALEFRQGCKDAFAD